MNVIALRQLAVFRTPAFLSGSIAPTVLSVGDIPSAGMTNESSPRPGRGAWTSRLLPPFPQSRSSMRDRPEWCALSDSVHADNHHVRPTALKGQRPMHLLINVPNNQP